MATDHRYNKIITSIRIRREADRTWTITCFNNQIQVLWHGTVSYSLKDLYERLRYIAPNCIQLWWHDHYLTLYNVHKGINTDGECRAIPEGS